MSILEGVISGETDSTLTIKFTLKNDSEYSITVIKAEGYTKEQLLSNWTRRAKLEYMRNPALFSRLFIDRINARHLKLLEQKTEESN